MTKPNLRKGLCVKRCMAYRTFLDAGIPVAAGSDFSPGPFDPRMAIPGIVTRTGWDGKTWGASQRITVEEALRVNTLNGAYNSHEEAISGSSALRLNRKRLREFGGFIPRDFRLVFYGSAREVLRLCSNPLE